MSASSAMPPGSKQAILTAEGVRRLYNTSPALVDQYKSKLMVEFNRVMYCSGHSQSYRMQITNKVLNKYNEKIALSKGSGMSIYRNRKEMKRDRVINKKKSQLKYETVEEHKLAMKEDNITYLTQKIFLH